MSTGGEGVRAKALSHNLEHRHHMLARYVELLDNLVNAQILEVLDDGGHRQTRTAEHSGAADPVGDALDRWTLGPVKRCHGSELLPPDYGEPGWPSRGLSPHTSRHRPWRALVVIEFDEEAPAIEFERYLKTGSGREFARLHVPR